MIQLNAIIRLGKDAIKSEVNGKTVINFTGAHTEKYRSGDEQKEKTTWLELSYWTDKTGILPYLLKGSQVYVSGTPELRTWEKDGKSGASLNVRINTVQLLGSAEGEKKEARVQAPADITEPLDDLPF